MNGQKGNVAATSTAAKSGAMGGFPMQDIFKQLNEQQSQAKTTTQAQISNRIQENIMRVMADGLDHVGSTMGLAGGLGDTFAQSALGSLGRNPENFLNNKLEEAQDGST